MSTPKQFYYGGNNTRASIVQNPAAYANDQSSGLFGVKEFRKFGYASDATKDRIADQEINKGYSRKKNPICPTCYISMPNTKECGNCE
jgi:hypothetical protein